MVWEGTKSCYELDGPDIASLYLGLLADGIGYKATSVSCVDVACRVVVQLGIYICGPGGLMLDYQIFFLMCVDGMGMSY